MTKDEYIEMLRQDSERSPYFYKSCWSRVLNPFLIDREIWRFQKLLRKCEYLYSKKGGFVLKIRKYYFSWKFKNLSIKLGFTIPCGCFGAGLKILHRGTIVVNANAKIGKNCTLNAGVNIGTKAGEEGQCPQLGNNIFIGPGAKLFGKIYIADGCAIGANAVVTKSFLEPNMIIAGVPAKVIGKVKRDLS